MTIRSFLSMAKAPRTPTAWWATSTSIMAPTSWPTTRLPASLPERRPVSPAWACRTGLPLRRPMAGLFIRRYNIQPRFGFAYRLSRSNVLRGSFGRFFDNWAAVNQMAQNYEGTWPSTGQLLANNLNQQNPVIPAENPFLGGAALPAPTPFQQVQWYMDPLIQNPYAWQWNFGIQHSLGQNTVLTANYAGATDLRLDEGIYSNVAVTPGPGGPDVVASRQPYPFITPTFYDRSVGKGYYHAFQFSLDRKTSKGLTYLISYTYSKMIDYGSDGWFGVEGTSIQDPYNLK